MTHSGNCGRIAVVMLHDGCDMFCRFCVTAGRWCLEWAETERLLVRLHRERVSHVVFGGGEPFAWPHGVREIARVARAMGFHVQVGTNGVSLPEGFARFQEVDRYVLPLEAADAATHDRLRRHAPSHHALVLDRLARLREAGKSVTVSTVVTSETAAGLGRLAAFLEAYAAGGGALHAWHLYRFLPVGRGGARAADRLAISEEAYRQACDALRGHAWPFRIFRRPDMYRSRTVTFYPRSPRPAEGGFSDAA